MTGDATVLRPSSSAERALFAREAWSESSTSSSSSSSPVAEWTATGLGRLRDADVDDDAFPPKNLDLVTSPAAEVKEDAPSTKGTPTSSTTVAVSSLEGEKEDLDRFDDLLPPSSRAFPLPLSPPASKLVSSPEDESASLPTESSEESRSEGGWEVERRDRLRLPLGAKVDEVVGPSAKADDDDAPPPPPAAPPAPDEPAPPLGVWWDLPTFWRRLRFFLGPPSRLPRGVAEGPPEGARAVVDGPVEEDAGRPVGGGWGEWLLEAGGMLKRPARGCFVEMG